RCNCNGTVKDTIRIAVVNLLSDLREELGNGKLTARLVSDILYELGNKVSDLPRLDCGDPPLESSANRWGRFFFGKNPEKFCHIFPDELKQGHVIDHILTYPDKFVCEPYGFGLEGCKAIISVAERYGLDVWIQGTVRHMPGFCVRVEFRKPKVAYAGPSVISGQGRIK
ncbi:MAG: hypothetical protein ACREBQ_12565, partial [Nitrososphaerales archaeon]